MRVSWLALRLFATRYVIALVSGFLLLSGVLYGQDKYAQSKIDEIKKVGFQRGVLNDSGSSDDPGKPANFLIVGSDSRAFVSDNTAQNHFGDPKKETGQRSDTIMIAHVDPHSKQALLVSFPRDTWVRLPGGCHEKINAAFNADYRCAGQHGGPDMLVSTIKENFNVSINHYLEIDFVGFRRIVDVLGHVSIYFPTPARDKFTGLSVQGGCQKLDGLQALAYARSRHYQFFDYAKNDFRSDPLSDFGRIHRQQYFMRTLMQSAIDQGARSFLTANRLVDRMVSAVHLDSKFNLDDMKRLLRTFNVTNPGSLPMETLPTKARGNGALDPTAESELMLQQLRTFAPAPTTTTTTLPAKALKPNDVKIDVRNASGTANLGAETVTALHKLGFQTRPAATAPTNTRLAHSELRYTTANAGKALVALRYLDGNATLVHDESLVDADVVLVLGSDWRGVVDPKTTTTTRPTTTTKPPSTTVELPNPGTPPPGTPANKIGHQVIGCR